MKKAVFALTQTAVLALGTMCFAAEPPAGDPEPGRGIGVVPFYNLAGAPEAVAKVMPEIRRRLERRGLTVSGGDRVMTFLRQNRIRARHELSDPQARALARELGVRYLIVGTIDVWALNGGPEIGLSARILEPDAGRTVWAGSAGLHAVEVPGLLAMARPDTLEEGARKATRQLLSDLPVRKKKKGGVITGSVRRKPRRSALANKPIFYRDPEFNPSFPLRVVVLPLTNRTLAPDAPGIVSDHLLAWLHNAGNVDVVDPGELRRTMVENDIQPLYGMDGLQLSLIRRILGANAVLDGSILKFQNGGSPVPAIDLYVRLRDTRTGKVLWAATTSRRGDQSRTVYDFGKIQGVDRLTRAALGDLLSTLLAPRESELR